MKVLLAIQLVLWSGSAYWLFRKSNLQSWIKTIYVISVFPLLEVLVVLNIYLTSILAPELLEFVGNLESGHWSGRIVAPFAFLAAAPLTISVFLAWANFIEFIDRRLIQP